MDALTFVPIPPSKAKSDPLYDDRMVQLLTTIRNHPPLDIRELILQTRSTEAVHGMVNRPRPHQIEAIYTIDEKLAAGLKQRVAIVDERLDNRCTLPSSEVCTVSSVSGSGDCGLVSCKKSPRHIGSVEWSGGCTVSM